MLFINFVVDIGRMNTLHKKKRAKEIPSIDIGYIDTFI